MLQYLQGARPLNCKQGDRVAHVSQLDVPLQVALQPRKVFANVRGVHDEHVSIAEMIYEQIVDDSAIDIAHRRILRFTFRQSGYIVDRHTLEKSDGISSPHFELPHVRHVEHSRRIANRRVLFHDAGVLHRHFKAAEFDHLGAERLMQCIEWGDLHVRRSSHGETVSVRRL